MRMRLQFQRLKRGNIYMSMKEIDLTGGESVYCINEGQLEKAYELVMANTVTADKVNAHLKRLEERLDRNERAALAFILIDRLLKKK
ncbi:conserved hypothetical protein [Candidatus Zixiibacteriota bacterium]|nr:conserved hypothetical protein [candidate division Zixibacteria bacterium]